MDEIEIFKEIQKITESLRNELRNTEDNIWDEINKLRNELQNQAVNDVDYKGQVKQLELVIDNAVKKMGELTFKLDDAIIGRLVELLKTKVKGENSQNYFNKLEQLLENYIKKQNLTEDTKMNWIKLALIIIPSNAILYFISQILDKVFDKLL